MRSLSKGAIATAICCLLFAFLFVAPPKTQGDEWNLKTRFTVNHPFEVPGVVLQANTPYVMRLLDSPSNRNVVLLYNDDEDKLLTTFMAISDERQEPTDKTQFTFLETKPGFPMPIKEWFYPGRLIGLEFVYPKAQAFDIATHANEAVLAADSNDLSHMATITVEAVKPVERGVPVAESTANITKTENTAVLEEKPSVDETPLAETPSQAAVTAEQQVVEEHPAEPAQIAQNTNDSTISTRQETTVEEQEQNKTQSVVQEKGESSQTSTSTATQAVNDDNRNNRELPATAGEMPVLALIGILCLGAGLGLRVVSAKS